MHELDRHRMRDRVWLDVEFDVHGSVAAGKDLRQRRLEPVKSAGASIRPP